jgi:hypothetical protein
MEPLDHHGIAPQPDATADVHSELDTLARVVLTAAETIARTAARRSTKEAKAIERAATAEMADAADRAEQAKADLSTGTASAIPATGPVTIGDLLAASHPDLVAPSPASAPVTSDLDQPATTLATTLDAATTSTGTPPAPAEASALDPTVEVPVTIQDLLDASHPLSVQEELAAAQAAAGTVPVEAMPSYELTSTADLGLG